MPGSTTGLGPGSEIRATAMPARPGYQQETGLACQHGAARVAGPPTGRRRETRPDEQADGGKRAGDQGHRMRAFVLRGNAPIAHPCPAAPAATREAMNTMAAATTRPARVADGSRMLTPAITAHRHPPTS